MHCATKRTHMPMQFDETDRGWSARVRSFLALVHHGLITIRELKQGLRERTSVVLNHHGVYLRVVKKIRFYLTLMTDYYRLILSDGGELRAVKRR